MTAKVNLAGFSFGRLTVRDFVGIDEKNRTIWLCECSCGGTKLTNHEYLLRGKTKSCGCLKRESQWKPRSAKSDQERMEALLVMGYKTLKRRNAYKFKGCKPLGFDHFKKLSLASCVYCGEKASKILRERDGELFICCNGIDRVDSSLGYAPENCVTACKACNVAKNSMGVETFMAWVSRIYAYNVKNSSK